jgi:hypothetical protein
MRTIAPLCILVALGCGAGSSSGPAPAASPASGAAPAASSSSGPGEQSVITDRSQLDAAVGQHVVIRGVQTRTKIPTVLGVDVAGPYEHSDKEVTAAGVLHRWEVKPEEVNPRVASRGAGVFYRLVDPKTGGDVKTQLAE